ncbi:MAG: hypothetical protein DRJ38_04115 [Thermoprotei archaeon]|nr:MAG: hypothetical protein DRJ38_04115 [Thermoprotei archaeon]
MSTFAMKNVPIIKPAIQVDRTATITAGIPFKEKHRLYPIIIETTSKTKDAIVNPKKCIAPGLKTKFNSVAINPVSVAAPNFLAHQVARNRDITASMSHRKGRCVRDQNIGAKVILRTDQNAALMTMIVISLLVKYGCFIVK